MSGNNLPLHAIQPPPETTYSSHDAAEAALHQWTLDHGFNVSRRRVRYKGGPEREIWARNYECDRAGAPKNTQHLTEHDRKRTLRGSKRSACPMRIGIRAVDKDDTAGQWKIVHTARSTHHNHQPSRDVRVHAQHRRRAIQATSQPLASHTLDLVELQTAARATPSTIHATVLSAGPRSFIVVKDISNAKDASRRHDLASRTATEALFQELVKHKFFYKFRLNPETNEVTHLFWAHPATTALFKFHFDVLVADCTYKTNKYRLPLLNIIVITGASSVLPVAQCWVPGEKDEDFVWAFNMLRLLMIENDIDPTRVILTDHDLACVNALDRVFPDIPSMVCRWHMNKNVEAIARKHLGQVDVENSAPGQPKKENSWQTNSFMASFYEAVDAETEADFNAKREDLIEKCKPVSDYLDLHWWKYKTRIVKHCTNKYMHFGVRDTSTVEGAHAKIKSKLESSQGDLYTVFKKLLSWWTIAASETRLLMEQNAVTAPHIFQKNRYSRVARIITRAALGETERLWKDAEKIVNSGVQRSKCSGVFRVVHGRPCLHELISIVESNGQRFLAPHDFDKHWWIYRDQDKHTVPRIQEPATIRTIRKGKRQAQHRKNQGKRGTGREPSFSERMDLSHPATPPTMVGLPPIDMQQLGSYEGDVILSFEDAFLPPRSWGFAGRIPFTDQQPNPKP